MHEIEKQIDYKRTILLVEDNEMNREILAELLEDEYHLLMAENGEVGLAMLEEHINEISVVLLDVYMPVCDGFEFLERAKQNPMLEPIPIVVTTGSNRTEDEVRCLDLGAVDFVTKPYNPKIVRGRIRSIIKLRESVATLSAVEFDPLTGAFNIQAFYHYAKRKLAENEDTSYDLIVVALQDFQMVNGSFGEKKGDDILRYFANFLYSCIPDLVLARKGDKFFGLFSSEHRLQLTHMEEMKRQIAAEAPILGVIVKVGYYSDVERGVAISMLCERVLLAVNGIKNDITKSVAYYDDEIIKKRVEEQKMEARFDASIENNEFAVWFQPKVDCLSGEIVAAEALVRWMNPDGSMISPGVFIPLFEKDGLVCMLDAYVFKQVCKFQKRRLESGETMFPISVNLSRNSIFQMDIPKRYREIVDEVGIPIELVPLELTESAATSGGRIVQLAKELVEMGFNIHMDDFGAGYSSLSSLSVLPFDEIKLDKSLIDQIGKPKGDIIVKHTIKIAQELGIKVVAEGVEDQEQLDFLRQIGCEFIQGYYFAAPSREEHFLDLYNNWKKGEG